MRLYRSPKCGPGYRVPPTPRFLQVRILNDLQENFS